MVRIGKKRDFINHTIVVNTIATRRSYVERAHAARRHFEREPKQPRVLSLALDRFVALSITYSSSGVPAYAVFNSTIPRSSTMAARMRNFCALPVTVIGISDTKRTWRGTL